MLPAVNPLITRSFSIPSKTSVARCNRETERPRTKPRAGFCFAQFCTRKQRCNVQQTFLLNCMALSESSTPSATDPISMLLAFESLIRNSFLFSCFPERLPCIF